MEVMTLQMGKRFQIAKAGIVLLDTTFMSGRAIYAPTKQMVYAHKDFVAGRGDYDDAAYERDYHPMMLNSWRINRQEWLADIKAEHVHGVTCYCAKGQFCHRHLLVKYFEAICKKIDVPFVNYGEYQ